MSLPTFTMRQLLEDGVHFGHNTRRWNPKMAPYLFGVRNNVHIIDLQQTVPLLYRAMQAVHDTVAGGGRVCSRHQTASIRSDCRSSAKMRTILCQPPLLGGMLTNFKTISASIKRLRDLEEQVKTEAGRTKKEILTLNRELAKARAGPRRNQGNGRLAPYSGDHRHQ